MQHDPNTFWHTVASLTFTNEAEVETRLILPLLEVLGWSNTEIHSKVAVEFHQGRKTGKFPEADFVLAPEGTGRIAQAWVVIEAKRPTDKLKNVDKQAHSYAYMLRAPFFLTTNGIELEIWQTGWFSNNKKVFESKISHLPAARGQLEGILHCKSVKAHLDNYSLPDLTLKNQNIDDYLLSTVKRYGFQKVIDRTLLRNHDEKKPVLFSSQESSDWLKDGIRFDIAAWGGRGKSSLLTMLVQNCLSNTEERIPIVLPLENVIGTLFEYLTQLLRPTIPALSTPDTVREWLRHIKTLLLLDNWDKLTEVKQRSIENDLMELENSPCAVILTRRPHITGPKGIWEFFEIDFLTEKEQYEVVNLWFSSSNVSQNKTIAYQVLSQSPKIIKDVLREPIFLETYLSLIESSPQKNLFGFGILKDPLEIFQKCLHALLVSRFSSIERVLIEIHAICGFLGKKFDSFTLRDVAEILKDSGIEKSAPEFTEDMCACGLWQRSTGTSLSFVHDIWGVYFSCMLRLEKLINDNDVEELLEWILTGDLGDLKIGLSLIATQLSKSKMNEIIFNKILERDIELYLATLSRFKILDENFDASELMVKNYLKHWVTRYSKFIDFFFPKFKHSFNPWWFNNFEDKNSKNKLVIVTNKTKSSLFMLGFGNVDEEDVIFVPKKQDLMKTRWSPKHHIQVNSFSPTEDYIYSSFDVIETIFKNLQEIIKQDLPAIGWIKRERLVVLAINAFRSRDDRINWREFSISDLLNWIKEVDIIPTNIREALGLPIDAKANNGFFGSTTDRSKWVLMSEIVNLAESFEESGNGKTKLKDLMLPTPDLKYPKISWLSAYYSKKRKTERVSMFFEAVVATYREICEEYFSAVNGSFFYAQGPFHAVVNIYPETPSFPASIDYYWEPTSEWGELPIVTYQTLKAARQDRFDFDEISNKLAIKVQALGRANLGWHFHSGHFNWNSNEAAVSKMVSELLESDIKRFQKLLNGN